MGILNSMFDFDIRKLGLKIVSVIFVGFVCLSPAFAQNNRKLPGDPRYDNGITGTIYAVEIWSGTGFTARVYFSDIAPGAICPGGTDFAYLDSADANFQSQLSVVLTAHATRRKLTAYVNLVNTQCKIMVAGML